MLLPSIAIIQNAAAMGITLANDPIHLKTLYLDISCCIPFWEVAMDEHCPTTLDLLLQADRLVELRELQNVVDQIRANPFWILGKQWADIGQDIYEIKAEFNRGCQWPLTVARPWQEIWDQPRRDSSWIHAFQAIRNSWRVRA